MGAGAAQDHGHPSQDHSTGGGAPQDQSPTAGSVRISRPGGGALRIIGLRGVLSRSQGCKGWHSRSELNSTRRNPSPGQMRGLGCRQKNKSARYSTDAIPNCHFPFSWPGRGGRGARAMSGGPPRVAMRHVCVRLAFVSFNIEGASSKITQKNQGSKCFCRGIV